MVTVHDVERKVPCKVLEAKIENVSFQYVVENTSPIDNCITALDQIAEHLRNMKKELEEKKALEEQNQSQE